MKVRVKNTERKSKGEFPEIPEAKKFLFKKSMESLLLAQPESPASPVFPGIHNHLRHF